MFEGYGEARERRIRESQARAKAEDTRRTILDLLRDGPMTRAELRAKLGESTSLSLLNYHLTVLLDARQIASEGGLYRRT
jgi:DNA-binding transcriptional ArsR family regulator